MRYLFWTSAAVVLAACSGDNSMEPKQPSEATTKPVAEKSADPVNGLTQEQIRVMNTTPVTSARYPAPPEPHFGPAYGSITFADRDPGPTIGGTLTMKPAENQTGITMYMIHWGLEVGEPGIQDDKGAGDLGGDCMGFRDTGHVVMKPAAEAGDLMTWEIPHGTIVPDGAVYFVGHSLYGKIHNLGKCTQTPIDNLVNAQ